MLASIHPLGERARGNRWIVTVAWYISGSAAGGAAIGAALGAAFGMTGVRLRALPLALLCLAAAAVEASGRAVPSWRRQVNEDWLVRYRGWVYGAGFGVQLGAGAATTVTTAAVYLSLVLAAFSGSAVTGAVIGVTFGAARALPILSLATVDRPALLRRWHMTFARAASWAKGGTVVALLGVAVGGLR